MWIRSQDKKQLVNANDLYIATRSKGYTISTGKGNDLGTYSSEEKVIKVMDMIQGCLTGNGLQTGNILQIYETPRDCPIGGIEFHGVFQMPLDSEVKE